MIVCLLFCCLGFLKKHRFSTIAINGPLQPNMVRATPLSFEYRYGRVDDNDCVGLDNSLMPSAGIDYTGMVNLFMTRLKMTAMELSAIMGAHSLGKTTFANSGFEGLA